MIEFVQQYLEVVIIFVLEFSLLAWKLFLYYRECKIDAMFDSKPWDEEKYQELAKKWDEEKAKEKI